MEQPEVVDSPADGVRSLDKLSCLSLAVIIHDQDCKHVVQYQNGRWACTCDGFPLDTNCRHILQTRAHLCQVRLAPASGFTFPGVGIIGVPIQAIASGDLTAQTVGAPSSSPSPRVVGPNAYVVRNHVSRTEFILYHDSVFADIVNEQRPHTIFIGCSDSRVIPELVVKASPGHLFVVRNVGNIVPPHDSEASSVAAALSYGLSHLPSVKNLVVCGHYGCGAMHALAHSNPERADGELARWLALAKPVLDVVDVAAEEDFERALVEANVVYQIKERLCQYPQVRRRLAEKTITIYGMVYDLATGALSELLRVTSLSDVERLELRPSA